MQACDQPSNIGGRRQIGLGQHQPVGHGRLLHRFRVRVEGGKSVDRVDHRHHAVEPVAQQQIGVRHGGVQHRRRIGETRGFQQHPAKSAAAVVEIAQQGFQRVDQVAAHGAAQAAALQQHHVVADIFHQQMVEADFAELIDDDGGLGERGVLEQTVEQTGLAGAKKAGQHGERNGNGGLAPVGVAFAT